MAFARRRLALTSTSRPTLPAVCSRNPALTRELEGIRMTYPSRPKMTIVATVLMAAVYASSPSADHSWNGYHWARSSNPVQLTLGDNVSRTWDSYLAVAAADWNQSTVLNVSVGPGHTSKKNCRPADGAIEVCNGAYGFNGWLGVAQIWVSGKHITAGSTRMNDSYFNTTTYNSPAWRQLVICQEVGHVFGLDHQDENFDNAPLGTCMDYSNDPLPNQHPNAHDYAELESIYQHLDSTSSAASLPGAGNQADVPSEWGQLMKTTRGGRTQVFERDFGNGRKVVTFVIWA
jgi:hypothetical protein